LAEPAPSSERAGPRRALVFSGGGARGAYEAGVVRYLIEELPRRVGRPVHFDILCGTSVGAIHACYLAGTAEQDASRAGRLVDLWKGMRVDEVLPFSTRDLLALPRRLLGLRRMAERFANGDAPERIYGLLNTEPLERLVLSAIPWLSIRRNVREGRVQAVCVAATQIATGRVTVFIDSTQKRIERWSRDPMILPRPTHLKPTHALASAAIPLLFPAVRIGSTYYADGGLRLNTPLAPALRLGADKVLVIALRPNPHLAHEAAMAEQRVEEYASPVYLFGKVLNALMLDHLDTDLARMRVMNELLDSGEKAFGPDFLERINAVSERERGQRFRPIDDLVIRPSADLGVLAGQILDSLPERSRRSPLIRLASRSLSDDSTSAESDLLSYLLFDGEFVTPLTELGYADAAAQEEALCEFFTD
jgi:NTE family protein